MLAATRQCPAALDLHMTSANPPPNDLPPRPEGPHDRRFLALALALVIICVAAFVASRTAPPPESHDDRRATAADASTLAPPAPATPTQALAESPTPALAGDATRDQADEPAPADSGPLHITAEPDQLRVWSNTKVRLKIEVAGDQEFSKFVWHFEDGAEPVVGTEVEHVFAESVRDRHVTVEAWRPGLPPLVATHRLPVERLAVAPLDGGEAAQEGGLPPRSGTRILWVAGAGDSAVQAAVAQAASQLEVDAVVIAGDVSDTASLNAQLANEAPQAAVLLWSGDTQALPLLQVLRDPAGAVVDVQVADRSSGVLAVRDMALVAVDTRGQTIDESELKRVRAALQAGSAYSATLLASVRPLTMLRDGELIADRAYRLYEYALRQATNAVVSMTSEVFYDGRFGGLAVVAVGRAEVTGCPRLLGHDACQPASITLIELGDHRLVRALHLLGPDFDRAAGPAEMPPEVGKVRR